MNGLESTNALDGPLKGEAALSFRTRLALPSEQFIAQCIRQNVQFSGPGGSRRNRVRSGIRLRHPDWPLWEGIAGERRESALNLETAAQRLRLTVACEQRAELPTELPSMPWKGRKVSPEHPLYPWFVSYALDLLAAQGGSPAEAAERLSWSTSSFLRQLHSDKLVWSAALKIRNQLSLAPLLPPR